MTIRFFFYKVQQEITTSPTRRSRSPFRYQFQKIERQWKRECVLYTPFSPTGSMLSLLHGQKAKSQKKKKKKKGRTPKNQQTERTLRKRKFEEMTNYRSTCERKNLIQLDRRPKTGRTRKSGRTERKEEKKEEEEDAGPVDGDGGSGGVRRDPPALEPGAAVDVEGLGCEADDGEGVQAAAVRTHLDEQAPAEI
ncbi:hypothetical protein H6P81_002313 [Aristolochia fimbriata]|uniref:Uncharacterized protein n=1 Tax=Aristolochia fimbriata TaxID=158543 RepID=A0AAV7F9G1_ARIFI|nr:hypothetical protein H6P81_002313 [Aristolochia fimbriata]